MAISKWVPGIVVEIWADSQALTEHDLDKDEEDVSENVTTKYVEATSDQKFQIAFSFDEDFEFFEEELAALMFMDGEYVDGIPLITDNTRYGQPLFVRHQCSRDDRTGTWVARPFQFADLATHDGDVRRLPPGKLEQIRSIGLIDIKICRVRTLPMRVGLPALSSQLEREEVGAVPEKALKGSAISHKAKLGQAVPIEPRGRSRVQLIDPLKEPLVNFIFRYRSRVALQAMCIVPRDPTPETLEERAKRDPASLDYEELLMLQRQRNKREAMQVHVKQEQIKRERKRPHAPSTQDNYVFGSSPPSFRTPEVKLESCKRLRTSRDRGVELIVLCDD